MRATWHLAINSLAGRRLRTALLMIAIAAAITLMIAVATMLATINQSHAQSVGKLFGLAELRLIHRFHQRVDEKLAVSISQWPEVAHISSQFENAISLKHVLTEEQAIARGIDEVADEYRLTLESVGIEPDAYQQIRPSSLIAGRMIEKRDEIVLDELAAAALHAQVGDQLKVIRFGDPLTFTVTGIQSRPRLGVLQRLQGLILLDQAQEIGGLAGYVDQIEILLKPGSDAQAVRDRYSPQLPGQTLLQTTAAATAGLTRALAGARMMFNLTTALALIAAGFIIATSLTTAVSEQTRELAIFRCVGASRMQIGVAQLLAGAIMTTAGTLVGIPLGLGIAWTVYHYYQELLPGGFAPAWGTIGFALLASAISGLGSAAYPALVAARVSPVVGLSARAWKPSRISLLICLLVGLTLLLGPLIAFVLPIDSQTMFWFFPFAGMPLLLTGYFLVSVPLLIGVNALLARPISLIFKLPARLLSQSTAASPFRHGFTAAALMVSLALLINIWTGGRSFLIGWFDNIRIPDAFVHSAAPIPHDQIDALAALPMVTATSSITAFPVPTAKVQFGVNAYAPTQTLYVSTQIASFISMADLKWVQGDAASAILRMEQGGAVLVSQEFLIVHKLGIGDSLSMQTQFGPQDFEIAGVVASPGLDVAVQFFGIQRAFADASIGSVIGTKEDALKYWGVSSANLVLLSLKDNVSDDKAMTTIQKLVPGARAGSSRRIRNMVHYSASQLMSIASCIAMLGLAVACIAVGNLIMAGIHARRFEFGVIRAIGGSRPMLIRLIASQTLIIALTACLLGFCMGLEVTFIAQQIHHRLAGFVYGLIIPWDVTLIGSAAVILAIWLAAMPAITYLLRVHPRELLAVE